MTHEPQLDDTPQGEKKKTRRDLQNPSWHFYILQSQVTFMKKKSAYFQLKWCAGTEQHRVLSYAWGALVWLKLWAAANHRDGPRSQAATSFHISCKQSSCKLPPAVDCCPTAKMDSVTLKSGRCTHRLWINPLLCCWGDSSQTYQAGNLQLLCFGP